MERSVCEISSDARVPAGESGHEHRRVQRHLLGGNMSTACSGAWSAFVFIVPLLWFVARGRLPSAPGLAPKLFAIFAARRFAGSIGLVHGAKRPGRRPARVAAPAHRASGSRVADLRGDVLDCAYAPAAGGTRRCAGSDRSFRAAVARCGTDFPHGTFRRPRRRHPCGIRLQHLSAHERPRRAAGNHVARVPGT